MRRFVAVFFGLFVAVFVAFAAGPDTQSDLLLAFAAGWTVFALILWE